ncbi:hypothetical protein MJD09_22025 [bacterium]|nr:hypothetical protein [bacterium]
MNEDSTDEDLERRIQFKRLRRRTLSSKSSVRMKILFAIFLVIFLYYFQGLLEADRQDFKIEEIKIEELPEL